MAETKLKTTATEVDAAAFLDAVPNERRRDEGKALDAIYRRVTGLEPKMWGPSIVGYGQYAYTYDSGRSGTMARAGFSPRKAALTLYLDCDAEGVGAEAEALLARLGPHERSKACLYIKRLDKVDSGVLEELVRLSWDDMNAKYPD